MFGQMTGVGMSPSLLVEEETPGSELAWPAAALRDAGIEVIEYLDDPDLPEPLIRFSGGRSEGWRALAAAMQAGLSVGELRRVWQVAGGEPIGPWWELTLQVTSDLVETNDNRGELAGTAKARHG